MEKVSKEFYVLSRLHDMGIVSEEKALTDEEIAKLLNMDPQDILNTLKKLEERNYVVALKSNELERYHITGLGIIAASAIYT